MENKKTVLVIGASRGLGYALAEEFCKKEFKVISTVRSKSDALEGLKQKYADLEIKQNIDVTNLDTLRALKEELNGRQLDILFVNAGIALSNEKTPISVRDQDYTDMMLTNALNPVRIVELFHENVAGNGVIAIMSSEIGSITNSTGFWPLYSSSKAALNMLMKSFAATHPNDTRALLLVAPGWVKTDMGTQDALLEISDSIPLVADMTIANLGKPGLRYTDRFGEIIPW